VKVWDVSAGRCVKDLVPEESPTGIQLLDPETRREFATLEDPPRHRPHWMAFTPDGTRLVMAAQSAPVIHVWDLRLLRSRLNELGLDWN